MYVNHGYWMIQQYLLTEDGFGVRFHMQVRKDGRCVGIGYFAQYTLQGYKRGDWCSTMTERIIARRLALKL